MKSVFAHHLESLNIQIYDLRAENQELRELKEKEATIETEIVQKGKSL